jgi:hypothetical protein
MNETLSSRMGPPELGEFLKETEQEIFQFCYYLVPASYPLDEVIVSIYRDFGDIYRKLVARREHFFSPIEFRVRLFQLAWEKVRNFLGTVQFWNLGRDTRDFANWEKDLLSPMLNGQHPTQKENWEVRLRAVDLDHRLPLVLRDILGFDDELILRILGLRWGVYRHRLHRGRLELCDSLKGTEGSLPSGKLKLAPKEKTHEF